MSIQRDVITWHVRDVHCHRGGRMVVPAAQAPFGRVLPYRRAAGEEPAAGCAGLVRSRGWIADLGQRGLPELVLGLGAVAGLNELTPDVPLHYSGPHPELMKRCSLLLASSSHSWGPHVVRTGTRSPVRFRVDPGDWPTWLDQLDSGRTEVHSALPMRHYLAVEQSLGVRLARDEVPAPSFISTHERQEWHVVLVTVAGWPSHLDFQLTDFAEVARELMRARAAPWRFTVIVPRSVTDTSALAELPVQVIREPSLEDCVDLFASAELVIGNDVGLTQLAALAGRADGNGPQVVGLFSRNSHTKWITGSTRHHGVATRFSQMLALADRNAEPAEYSDSTWGAAADMRNVPREVVADFAGRCVGWW